MSPARRRLTHPPSPAARSNVPTHRLTTAQRMSRLLDRCDAPPLSQRASLEAALGSSVTGPAARKPLTPRTSGAVRSLVRCDAQRATRGEMLGSGRAGATRGVAKRRRGARADAKENIVDLAAETHLEPRLSRLKLPRDRAKGKARSRQMERHPIARVGRAAKEAQLSGRTTRSVIQGYDLPWDKGDSARFSGLHWSGGRAESEGGGDRRADVEAKADAESVLDSPDVESRRETLGKTKGAREMIAEVIDADDEGDVLAVANSMAIAFSAQRASAPLEQAVPTRRHPKVSVTAPPLKKSLNPQLPKQKLRRPTRQPIRLGKINPVQSFPAELAQGVVQILDDSQDETCAKSRSPQFVCGSRASRSQIPASQFYSSASETTPPLQHKAQLERSSWEKSRKGVVECGGEKDVRFRQPSEEDLEDIRRLTLDGSKHDILATIKEANIDLRLDDFRCLRGSRWLSDEILNSFISLINARNKQYYSAPISGATANAIRDSSLPGFEDAPTSPDVNSVDDIPRASGRELEIFERPRPRVHVFNTFFFARLSQGGYDYDGVKRWLKRAGRDVLSLDLIMFPINISNLHWVLAAIDVRGKALLYFDSTFGSDSLGALGLLRRWLRDEVENKHGADVANAMGISSWKSVINPSYNPRQKDDGSCGIFALYMAEFLERGKRPSFIQKNIRALRQRTVLFLRDGKLPDD